MDGWRERRSVTCAVCHGARASRSRRRLRVRCPRSSDGSQRRMRARRLRAQTPVLMSRYDDESFVARSAARERDARAPSCVRARRPRTQAPAPQTPASQAPAPQADICYNLALAPSYQILDGMEALRVHSGMFRPVNSMGGRWFQGYGGADSSLITSLRRLQPARSSMRRAA